MENENPIKQSSNINFLGNLSLLILEGVLWVSLFLVFIHFFPPFSNFNIMSGRISTLTVVMMFNIVILPVLILLIKLIAYKHLTKVNIISLVFLVIYVIILIFGGFLGGGLSYIG